MSSSDRHREIAFTGEANDVAFMVGLFRQQRIPFRQIPTFPRGPVISLPWSHESRLRQLLKDHGIGRNLEILSPSQVRTIQAIFWLEVAAAVGLMVFIWLKFFRPHP